MLKGYDASKYDRPSVAVDVLLFTIEAGELKILLVQRNEEPFKGRWSLPGGFVKADESLDRAAIRELGEESGVENIYLEQLYTFGDPKRDPRTRVISVTYMALGAKTDWGLKASGDVSAAKFFSVDNLPKLAFDHQQIFHYGLERLRSKLGYTNIAFGLLPEQFTLTDLQKVYEIILNKQLDKRNFRKKILTTDLLRSLGKKSSGGAHRPAELYRFKKKEIVYTD
ncbi:MAG: NUDIX hydrolase [Candidatus Collierbacteria bacterium GW2011_GWB1_44_6]|uniref:NUDIX hydrolase n=2 Tax=Candidatus Collieribacteriota TaxID=1752725 RepID=A0A0G1JQ51_9BACT|nr:MAG: NUDIX hydrolase [Candidatus Collierbacteria bacterium GW2011_GWC2_43_12]KKT73498.1 MAG: NUDIX hydrolase [Candidatus Collierbacteria bacterium GW2011_GWB1_44_6]KKT83879.1 MAG: NUDIX hydrolase [Microgenomates group bacterium GW2011_GWC1_44_9]